MAAPMEPLVQLYEELKQWKDETDRRFAAMDSHILSAIVEARDAQRVRWTTTHGAVPCGHEVALNESPETHTHEVAPPPDGFAAHDEPPSRPL